MAALDDLMARARARMMPPGRVLPSEWALAHRRLSPEASAEPGRWTNRLPFQAAMMDAVATHALTVLATASQVGKSECLLNVLGSYIHTDPCPCLLVLPTLEQARSFSRDRLTPLFRDTPVLAALFPPVKSRAAGQHVLRRQYKGGQITLAGANAAAGLASKPIKLLLMDEVSRYPEQAGSEGDPVKIAMQRTSAWHNSRTLLVSTPTNRGECRITSAFEASSGCLWYVPCPQCGHEHPLEWGGVKWDAQAGPESARFVCPKGCEFNELSKRAAVLKGRWIAQRPGHATAGFRVNALASPFADVRTLTAEFLQAKDHPQQLKAFINLRLALPFEDVSHATVEVHTIQARAEDYGCELPQGARVICGGVDVQRDRLALELVAFGEGPEAWGLHYEEIPGDTVGPVPWKALDELLAREFTKADGTKFKAARVAVDGAFNTEAVHRYCVSRAASGVFMAWGSTNRAAAIITRGMRDRRAGWMVGVHQLKETFLGRLKLAAPSGPGALHWPIGRGYDHAYFQSITAEELRPRKKYGFKHWHFIKIRERNEGLDCRVLAMACLARLGPDALKAAPAPLSAPRRTIPNSFVNAWRE